MTQEIDPIEPIGEPIEPVGETDLFTVSEMEAGLRLDKILTTRYQDVRSRTYFQSLISADQVLVNGHTVKKRLLPKAGDEVEIRFVLTPEIELSPEAIPLDILYEDEHIVAINKPPGLVVHPAPGNWTGTFVNALLHHCGTLPTTPENLRPGIVHRLDKDTSGVLIAAKTALAHQKLCELFASRKMHKEYLAIVIGNPGEGIVEAPIGRHPVLRKTMAVRAEGGRDAVTRYHTMAHKGDLAIVRIELITGRTHQARVHMKHIGTPVLGDQTYGSTKANQKHGLTRQMLHAERLKFPHPITGEMLDLRALPPTDMVRIIQQIEPKILHAHRYTKG